MKRKLLALMLAGIMVMATLAGCNSAADGGGTTKAPEADKTTAENKTDAPTTEEATTEEIDYSDVTFRIAWWGGDARNTNTMAMIEEFEKQYPGLKVEVEFNGNFNDYFTSMNTQAAGGDLPDVFQMDVSKIYTFASNKQLMDLTGLIDDGSIDMTNVPDSAVAAGAVCDGIYGVACGLNGYALQYNPELAEKAGVTIKNGMTWSEFWAAAKTVFEKTGARVTQPQQAHEVLFRSLGGDKFKTNEDAFNFTKEGFKEYGMIYLKGYTEGLIATNENCKESGLAARYKAEEVWCDFTSSNQIGSYEKNSEKKLALVTQPISDNATVVDATYMKPAMLWSVAKNTDQAELAAAFIDFYVNNTVVYDICGIDRGVPISTAIQSYLTPNLSDSDKKQFEYIAYLGEHSTPINLYTPANGAEAWNSLFDVIYEETMMGVIADEAQLDKRIEDVWEPAQKIISGK